MISKLVAGKAKFVLPVTKNLADAMQSHGINGKYKVVPNTVDIKIFNTDKKETRSQFAHVSSLDERQKNFSGIVNAFNKVSAANPELKLMVAGGADNILHAKGLVEQSGINREKIIFLGNKNQAEIAQLLSQSIVLVLFSNYENQPCVILESLACGTPIVATDVGGVGEIVNMQNGILVKPGNQSALAEAMLSVLAKKNMFIPEQLAEKIKQQYSFEAVNRQLNEVYESATS
jgi:glycosyltransferase involved in cell wall biosynthesis